MASPFPTVAQAPVTPLDASQPLLDVAGGQPLPLTPPEMNRPAPATPVEQLVADVEMAPASEPAAAVPVLPDTVPAPVPAEACFPYTADDGRCRFQCGASDFRCGDAG